MNTPFSQTQAQALAALVAQIIPASKEFALPGADDPAILAEILTAAAPLHDRLGTALGTLGAGADMDAARAGTFRQAFAAEAEMIQTLTAQCYYRDHRVMRALSIAPRPPFPKGYAQIPNDFSLLEPVRKRGDIYRKV